MKQLAQHQKKKKKKKRRGRLVLSLSLPTGMNKQLLIKQKRTRFIHGSTEQCDTTTALSDCPQADEPLFFSFCLGRLFLPNGWAECVNQYKTICTHTHTHTTRKNKKKVK